MKILYKWLFATLISGCIGCSSPVRLGDKTPNIVFILADDLGWADLPVYGNEFNEAPNITKLAEEGMKFDNAYAACPVCSPTRASILTGKYPATVGVTDWIDWTGRVHPARGKLIDVPYVDHLPLGEIALLRGDPETAETRLELANRTNPQAVGGYFLRGYVAWKRGDDDRARKLLGSAREALGPEWTPEGMTSEGDVRSSMHVDETPLSRYWESWNGEADPATAFAELDRELRRRSEP